MTLNKQAMRKKAIEAKETDDWGCDDGNFHDLATPDAVLALLDELEALALENIRLKAGISGLIGLGIRHGDVEVMRLAGDAQMSTPCTDSIIENISAGIKIKGE